MTPVAGSSQPSVYTGTASPTTPGYLSELLGLPTASIRDGDLYVQSPEPVPMTLWTYVMATDGSQADWVQTARVFGSATITEPVAVMPGDNDLNATAMTAETPVTVTHATGFTITLSPGVTLPADPSVTAADDANAANLTNLGYVADPTAPWNPGEWGIIGAYPFYWDGSDWKPGSVPTPLITTVPGAQLPADPIITGSDAVNAGAMNTLPYDAQPHTPWDPGQSVWIGAFQFYWDGMSWQPGSAPTPNVVTVMVTAHQASPSDAYVQFDASNSWSSLPGAVLTYDWHFGDGTDALDGGPAPTHTYPTAGQYGANVTVSDQSGAATSNAITITVARPAPPNQLVQGSTYDDILGIDASDTVNAVRLQAMNYVGSPLTVWDVGTTVWVNTFEFYWTNTEWKPGAAPAPTTHVAPGDVLPSNAQVVGSERNKCLIITQLGYTADPQTPWNAIEYATIGTDPFFWDGVDWHVGIAPARIALAPGSPDGTVKIALDPTWTAADVPWVWRPYYDPVPNTFWDPGVFASVQNRDPIRWDGIDWQEDLASGAPGVIFMPNPAITTSDPENAAKLDGLGYGSATAGAWGDDEWMDIGAQTHYQFHWDGSTWLSIQQYIPPATVGTVMRGDTRVLMADQATADQLVGYGYVADPQSAWAPGEQVLIGNVPFHWDGSAWHPRVVPYTAHPGDVFPENPDITGQDDYSASVAGLDYIPVPTSVWASSEVIKIGTYFFTWSGNAWRPAPQA